jgi:4-hydroxybenzoyl-CoA thioesterase
MAFCYPQKVLFKYCDPAGIVFFPRYFEMMNDCVETFFADALDWPFQLLLRTDGVPTASIETRFLRPSRHGDMLELKLSVEKVGRTSLTYHMVADSEGEVRFETRATLVHVDGDGKPASWPDAVREKLKDWEDQAE